MDDKWEQPFFWEEFALYGLAIMLLLVGFLGTAGMVYKVYQCGIFGEILTGWLSLFSSIC